MNVKTMHHPAGAVNDRSALSAASRLSGGDRLGSSRNFSDRLTEVRVRARYLVAALVSRRHVDLLRVAGAACRS